ncbi:metal ABC transporter solute-binding protein, Zn/Mn family [Prauserella oleivorans]
MRAAFRALFLAALLLLPGCSGASAGSGGIVVTTNILGDLTRAVVGDQVPVTVLMKPDADPHSFAISAQEAARLEQADLVIHNGLGLEEGCGATSTRQPPRCPHGGRGRACGPDPVSG